ncbi:MAG: hypothetical protein K9K32_00010 [Halanaerobiales bacterium]|nr:hypothetical protein [Halanaerobiales bacterium]
METVLNEFNVSKKLEKYENFLDYHFEDRVDACIFESLFEYSLIRNPKNNQVITAKNFNTYNNPDFQFSISYIHQADVRYELEQVDNDFFTFTGRSLKQLNKEIEDNHLANFVSAIQAYNGSFDSLFIYNSLSEIDLISEIENNIIRYKLPVEFQNMEFSMENSTEIRISEFINLFTNIRNLHSFKVNICKDIDKIIKKSNSLLDKLKYADGVIQKADVTADMFAILDLKIIPLLDKIAPAGYKFGYDNCIIHKNLGFYKKNT